MEVTGPATPVAHGASHQFGQPDALSLPQYGKRNGQTGVYAPNAGPSAAGVLTLVAQTVYATRFFIADAMTVTKLAWVTATAAGADDAVHAGIYDAAGNRLATTGALSGLLNATGLKTPALPIVLPGNAAYYAALLCPALGGTAAVIRAIALGNSTYANMFGQGLGPNECPNMTGQSSLPATLTVSATNATPILFAARTD